ncbi:hypothetical protein [Pseudanabaena sp. lw0831]|uniref:hypothetical protein n=1 Tax=Pseudanabaena sp. lw0831 TaxID=1357935 RepID=UPI001F38860A|nr:hypothetical protein [Pseudanabaena sp. lw0831]
MDHPLKRYSFKVKWLCPLLIVLGIPLALVLFFIPLNPGILEFEFIPVNVLQNWDELEKRWAAFSLGLDFLFLIVYSTLSSLLCIRTAVTLESDLGIWIAWGQWFAALCDAVEDISLVGILFDSQMGWLAIVSPTAAFIKFLLLIIGLIYISLARPFTAVRLRFRNKS